MSEHTLLVSLDLGAVSRFVSGSRCEVTGIHPDLGVTHKRADHSSSGGTAHEIVSSAE